jgi:hypothetical protein
MSSPAPERAAADDDFSYYAAFADTTLSPAEFAWYYAAAAKRIARPIGAKKSLQTQGWVYELSTNPKQATWASRALLRVRGATRAGAGA